MGIVVASSSSPATARGMLAQALAVIGERIDMTIRTKLAMRAIAQGVGFSRAEIGAATELRLTQAEERRILKTLGGVVARSAARAFLVGAIADTVVNVVRGEGVRRPFLERVEIVAATVIRSRNPVLIGFAVLEQGAFSLHDLFRTSDTAEAPPAVIVAAPPAVPRSEAVVTTAPPVQLVTMTIPDP